VCWIIESPKKGHLTHVGGRKNFGKEKVAESGLNYKWDVPVGQSNINSADSKHL